MPATGGPSRALPNRPVPELTTTADDGHNAALRNLANKLLSRVWWCLVNNQTWDETAAWSAATTPPTKAAA